MSIINDELHIVILLTTSFKKKSEKIFVRVFSYYKT